MSQEILRLSVKREWFDLMALGLKRVEVRSNSPWIRSRLRDHAGQLRHYDLVEFTNGYGNARPRFQAVFLHAEVCTESVTIDFSGSEVHASVGDYFIHFDYPHRFLNCDHLKSNPLSPVNT